MKRLVAGVAVAGAFAIASSIPTSHAIASHATAAHANSPARSATASDIVGTARRYLGSPYAYIGDDPVHGFSCIGFVHYVFGLNGVNVPYDIPLAWNSAPHVALGDLMPGDILFYSNTVFAGLSHVGIYIGNNQMIGADSFAVGVTVDTITDRYWVAHYTGATRPIAGSSAATAAPVPTATSTPAPQQVAATAPAGAQLRPAGTQALMYSGPGYDYTPIGTLPSTAVVSVVQAQGSWYDVRFGTTFGWVSAAALTAAPAGATGPSSVPPATPLPGVSRAAAVTGSPSGAMLVVTQGPLWVRSGPGKAFKGIGVVATGVRLTVLDQHPHWAHVAAPNGLVGWVSLQYVAPLGTQPYTRASTTTTQSGNPVAAQGTARVTASVLNVRSAPQSEASVITVVFAGETLAVIAHRGQWLEVRLRSGAIGWVSTRFVATE